MAENMHAKREEKITERGYAKINLHLDITGRLEGGYHSVATVMQSISLYDDVTLIRCKGEKGIDVSCNVEGVPCDERNLAVRALRLFFEVTGVAQECGLKLHIEKRIPMAAGMAGGSADAAATLRGVNRLYGSPLSTEELCEIGSMLGADVPFCIVGGTAFADGKGDRLRPISSMPDCLIVAACEGEGVSTPWAYGLLDRIWEDFSEKSTYLSRSVEPLLAALEAGDIEGVAVTAYNIFEEPVLRERPVAATVREILTEKGAMRAMMSGSGPSVFGIFADETDAEAASSALRESGYRPFLCRPIGGKSF